MKFLSNISARTYFLIIVGIALLLRLFGIWHDYPYSFFPDEAHFVNRSLAFGSGDLNPHWFHKPAFFMYILFFEYGVFFALGWVFTLWSSVEDFAVSFVYNPGPFYLIGRFTVTLFSIGTIIATYKIGQRHFNSTTIGLLAALLLAFSYGDIAASQDIKADIPAVFFAVLSTYFLLNYLEESNTRQLIFSVMAAGAGTATKFYPYAMLVPIGFTVLYIYGYPLSSFTQNWKKIIGLGISILAIFYATFFVCSPYNFLDPIGLNSTFNKIIKLFDTVNNFISSTQVDSEHDFIRNPMSRTDAVISYVSTIIDYKGMGIIIGTISIIGFISLLFSRSIKIYILITFPLIFIFISTFVYPGYAEPRHQLPVYAFLALGGGYLLNMLVDKTGKPQIIYILVALLIIPLSLIIERGIYVSKYDIRNVAKFWIEKNIPSGSKLVLDEYGPVLHTSADQLSREIDAAEKADKDGQFTAHYARYLKYKLLAGKKADATYYTAEIRFPWWRQKEPEDGIYVITENDRDMGNPLRPLGVKKLEKYISEGYEYVVVSSKRYDMFTNKDNERYPHFPSFVRFYKELFQRGKLVKEFSPETDNRPGPTIKIYQISGIQ